VKSKVRNGQSAERARVMTFPDPLLNASCVEDMFFVANQSGNHLVLLKLAPADWTFFPKTLLVEAFLACLSLLPLESGSIKRRNDFGDG